MSNEQEPDFSYPEYNETEVISGRTTRGRYPSKNERRQARKEKIEDKKHKSDGNTNTVPGTDPLARTSRAGGRQPGIHGH